MCSLQSRSFGSAIVISVCSGFISRNDFFSETPKAEATWDTWDYERGEED